MISVVGNIGCGKSSFLNNLENIGFEVAQEPVSDWVFLSKFYEDPSRWCFALQVEVMHTLSKNLLPGFIVERSPLEANKIFALNSFRNGAMTTEEYELIEKLSMDYPTPQRYIYIRTSPKTCCERIRKRSRSYESNISLDYLIDLHRLYGNFVKKLQEHADVLIIDGEQTESKMVDDFLSHRRHV